MCLVEVACCNFMIICNAVTLYCKSSNIMFQHVSQPCTAHTANAFTHCFSIHISQCFPNFFACGPPLASKNNHRSSFPCSHRYRASRCYVFKIKHCISELILDSYEYIPVAYVTMHCMTGH